MRRPPSNRPTEELLRRHEIQPPQVDSTAFREGWQVRSRLDTLLRDGLISPAEHNAAESWQRDFHAAAERSTSLVASLEMRPDGSCGRPEPSERQLRAIRHQRATAAALGPERVRILELLLIRDVSWRALAEQLQLVCPTTARAQAIDAPRALHMQLSGELVPAYRSRHRGRYQVRQRG